METVTLQQIADMVGSTWQTVDYWWKTKKIINIEGVSGIIFNKEDVVSFIGRRAQLQSERKRKKDELLSTGIKCLICGEQTKCHHYSSFTKIHLFKKHKGVTTKQYYDTYIINTPLGAKCNLCNKDLPFLSIKKGYTKYCSDYVCNGNNPELREKSKNTLKGRYGDSSYRNNEKHRETCLQKYGDANYTNREKYKVSWKKRTIDQHSEALDKSKKTRLLKYNNANYVNKEEITKKRHDNYLKSLVDKLVGFNCQLKCYNPPGEVSFTCADCSKVNTVDTAILYSRLVYNKHPCVNCFPIDTHVSQFETEIYKFIKENYTGKIVCSDRQLLDKLEVDILLPELKIAVEANGVYWHSDYIKDRNYHRNKTEACLKTGYRLLHVFEDEWIHKNEIIKAKILNILGKTTNKVMARKCEIRQVSSVKEQKEFLNRNHIQGWSNNVISYGLYLNNELNGMMSFDKPRTNKKYQWELSRYATDKDSVLMGGSSKLLSYFIKHHNPDNIISYADLSFSNGNMYEKIGFKLKSTSNPSYFYIDKITIKRHHRFNFNKKKLIKMGVLKDNETEMVAMNRLNKHFRIYDCGKMLYLWEKNERNK